MTEAKEDDSDDELREEEEEGCACDIEHPFVARDTMRESRREIWWRTYTINI
jgi:hypothetical protein